MQPGVKNKEEGPHLFHSKERFFWFEYILIVHNMWWENCRNMWVWVKTRAVSIAYRKWVYIYCSDKIVQWAVSKDNSGNSLYWGLSRAGWIQNASSRRSRFVFCICNLKNVKRQKWMNFTVIQFPHFKQWG